MAINLQITSMLLFMQATSCIIQLCCLFQQFHATVSQSLPSQCIMFPSAGAGECHVCIITLSAIILLTFGVPIKLSVPRLQLLLPQQICYPVLLFLAALPV